MSPGSASTRPCATCGGQGHADDAPHCRICGEATTHSEQQCADRDVERRLRRLQLAELEWLESEGSLTPLPTIVRAEGPRVEGPGPAPGEVARGTATAPAVRSRRSTSLTPHVRPSELLRVLRPLPERRAPRSARDHRPHQG